MRRTSLSNKAALAILLAATSFAAACSHSSESGAKSEKAAAVDPALQAAIASASRPDTDKARDAFRHPADTLTYFGVKPTSTVVEIWPGAGWYTRILGPYLSGSGKLIIAPPVAGTESARKMLTANAATLGKVEVSNFPSAFGGSPVAPGSADFVLTFRNVHNFRMGSYSSDKADYSAAAFAEMYAMLKPGGVLGIVDHRLPETADAAREQSSGYIKSSTVRALAEAAGFRFAGSSEVNANPKDTADHPNGVWTLPPALRAPEGQKEKYAAIGESDRMTLKFVKP